MTFVTQADLNGIDSQWNLFFTDLDGLLSEYEKHRPTNDIAITENLTIRLENAVRALQNVSHFESQTNREAVLEMTRNSQLMFCDCHRRCEFPSRTRCSQVAVLSLGHCLHGRSFICNRIGFDAVTEPGRFENAFKSGAFSKRYGFFGRVNGETESI